MYLALGDLGLVRGNLCWRWEVVFSISMQQMPCSALLKSAYSALPCYSLLTFLTLLYRSSLLTIEEKLSKCRYLIPNTRSTFSTQNYFFLHEKVWCVLNSPCFPKFQLYIYRVVGIKAHTVPTMQQMSQNSRSWCNFAISLLQMATFDLGFTKMLCVWMSLFCPRHPCDIFGVLQSLCNLFPSWCTECLCRRPCAHEKHLGVSTQENVACCAW